MRIPLLATLLLAGCGQSDPAITVTDARIAAGPRSAAIYATIDNRGGADRLVGIEVDGRLPISLHQTSNDGGVMRMRAVDNLEVPAGGRLELESGGAHGMAMGTLETESGTIPLTFRFERSSPVEVDARLGGPGGMAMEHEQ